MEETAIVEQLERLNTTASKILEAVIKPENKGIRALNIAAATVTVGGVIAIIQQILEWIGGK